MVILAIHVLAIAGIFVHSHFFEKPEVVSGESVKLLDTPRPPRTAREGEVLPQLREGEASVAVVGSESWEEIAAANQVDVEQLMKLNEGVALRSGIRLRLPAKTLSAREPELVRELNRDGESEVPVAVTPAVPVDRLREGLPMVSTLVDEEEPVLARPQVDRGGRGVEQRLPTREGTRPAGAVVGRSYQVKKGDTVWAIAKAHGVTPKALMQANGIKDASKLQLGATLKIPASR